MVTNEAIMQSPVPWGPRLWLNNKKGEREKKKRKKEEDEELFRYNLMK